MAEEHPTFSAFYDWIMSPMDWLGMGKQRRRTGAAAEGHTLEIGFGTGRNLPMYTNASFVVGIEPDPTMLRRARPRLDAAPCPAAGVLAMGEALPFPKASFDTVVAGLVLCTIPDVPESLREVRRVLRPGGRFLFIEHVRSRRSGFATLQDRITPLWKKLFAGCHPNRDTLAALEKAGFRLDSVWRSGDGPFPIVQGTALPE